MPTMIIVNCSVCSKEVEKELSRVNEAKKRGQGMTCSTECHKTARTRATVESNKTTPEKVFALIDKTPGLGPNGDCWEWRGHIDSVHGYGRIAWKERSKGSGALRAHKLVYELLVGEVPENLVLMHSCDHKICVNPAHLSLGTSQENTQDKVSKNRQAKGTKLTHFPHLTDEIVAEIKRKFRDGAMPAPIAREYGISKSAAKGIKYGSSWKHVIID